MLQEQSVIWTAETFQKRALQCSDATKITFWSAQTLQELFWSAQTLRKIFVAFQHYQSDILKRSDRYMCVCSLSICHLVCFICIGFCICLL